VQPDSRSATVLKLMLMITPLGCEREKDKREVNALCEI
jgi:hypothetical protein